MDSFLHISGKNIFITGASSGIGKACAQLASRFGANVILIGRNEERLKQVFLDLTPGNHAWFACDITRFDELENVVKSAVEKVGKLHGLIHSAGVESTWPFKESTAAYQKEMYDINVFAGLELARIISQKKYLNPKGSSFIFIASIMSVLGQPGKVAYCGSKGALLAAARAMALELAGKSVRVNCISPAIVETEMTRHLFEQLPEESAERIERMHPLGLGKPEDVASACLFLLSDASRWMTGSNLILDGGYSIQ